MLVKVDSKALEWRVKVFLSQDKVALNEIYEGIDIHAESQKAFKLPDRLTAKKTNFRMIFADAYSDQKFARPAYAYANDYEYRHVSSSIKFWERVVEAFFQKYEGMYQHGQNLIRQVHETGRIVNPTGRIYEFYHKVNKKGEPELPRTLILNYPVQGLAAELMAILRTVYRKRLILEKYDLDNKVLLMNTVHDDVQTDVDNDPKLIYNICILLEELSKELPMYFEKIFGEKFNVPLEGEVTYGPNLASMIEFNMNEKIKI